MEITLDRYLTDGKESLVTLALRSRTTEMHSAFSALDGAQKDAVNAALSKAMDDIMAVMRPAPAPTRAARATAKSSGRRPGVEDAR